MADLISRQAAYDTLTEYYHHRTNAQHDALQDALNRVPSAQPDIHYRKMGEWDMFELITSTWYGKQYYFMQDDEIVYSRASGKYMSVDKAIDEFLSAIGDN